MESIVPDFAYSVVWWSIYQQNLTLATFMTSLKNNWYTIVLFRAYAQYWYDVEITPLKMMQISL